MKHNIIISGLKEISNENCKELVQDVLKNKMKITQEVGTQNR